MAKSTEEKVQNISISDIKESIFSGRIPFEMDVTLNSSEKRKEFRKEYSTEKEVQKAMKEAGHIVKGEFILDGLTGEEVISLAKEALINKARPGWYKATSDEELSAYLSGGPVEIEAKMPSKTPWNAGDGKKGPKGGKKFDINTFDPSALSENELEELRKKLGLK